MQDDLKDVASFISESEFAEMILLSPETVRGWRKRGYGPRFYKFGGKVRYDRRDVAAFIEGSKMVPGDAA